MKSKQELLRKRVYNYYLENKFQGKKFTVDHFASEKIHKSTIYRIIERAENDSGHARVKGTGRIAKIMTTKGIHRLKMMFNNRDRVSTTQAARKFNCSQQFISKTLRKKTAIRCYKKKKIPNRNDKQREKIKTLCGRLYRKMSKKSCIIDDESYFTFSHSTINGNDNFYSNDVTQAPASIKFLPTAKYEKKLLVWICISEKGISRPYFLPSGLAINQVNYFKECIEKRLVPFIEEHHSDGEYVFWPDLATSHYADTVIKTFKANNINYVTKEDNPPNVPECRPIEDFWSILKGKVYNGNWQAKSHEGLKARIRQCIGQIDENVVQALGRAALRRLDYVRRYDIIENR